MRRSVRNGIVPALLMWAGGCGAANDPTQPPLPSPTPMTTPGGTVRGAYVFRVEPNAICRAPRPSFSFRVDATSQDGRRPGVRLVVQGAPIQNSEEPILEMEFLYATNNLQGSVATMPWIGSGVRSIEGTYLWIQGVAVGPVVSAGAGVGEVTEGTLMADLSFGRDLADRDGLGQCVAATHKWSLRLQ